MPKSAPAALVALCLSLAPAAMDAHAEPVLPAPPLQVEGTFWPLGSRVLSPDAPRRLISVDLGAAEDGGRPALEAGTAMTVFNVLGLWSALVVDVRKSCEFVCTFEEGETCHWQALLAPKLNAHYLGEPLLAIPAQHRVEAYEPLFARPAEAAVAWSPDFATPIWPPHGYDIRIEEWSGGPLASDSPAGRWAGAGDRGPVLRGHEDRRAHRPRLPHIGIACGQWRSRACGSTGAKRCWCAM